MINKFNWIGIFTPDQFDYEILIKLWDIDYYYHDQCKES